MRRPIPFPATATGSPGAGKGIGGAQVVFDALFPSDEKTTEEIIHEEIDRAIEVIVGEIRDQVIEEADVQVISANRWLNVFYALVKKGQLGDTDLESLIRDLENELAATGFKSKIEQIGKYKKYHLKGGIALFCMGASLHLVLLKILFMLRGLVHELPDLGTLGTIQNDSKRYFEYASTALTENDRAWYKLLSPVTRYLEHADSLPDDGFLMPKDDWIECRDYFHVLNWPHGVFGGTAVNWKSASTALSTAVFLNNVVDIRQEHFDLEERNAVFWTSREWMKLF